MMSNAVARSLLSDQLEIYARDLRRLFDSKVALERRLLQARAEIEDSARRLSAALQQASRRAADLEVAHHETVFRLMEVAAARDIETGQHLRRIQVLVDLLGRHLGWPPERRRRTSIAAALHDLGKIALPDSLLQTPGPLEPVQWELMKTHTVLGAQILDGSPSPVLELARVIALTHHENWDGSGYPHRLQGEEIPIEGRITLLADRYDALRSRRPYKEAFDHERAVKTLLEGDGRSQPGHLAPELADLFERIHPEMDEAWGRVQ